METSHSPHPWIEERKKQGPHLTGHEHSGLNGKIAGFITAVVGTMWMAYLFAGFALVALPNALQQGSPVVIVNWLSSNFLQLVLLPIIIVGQQIQAKASDKQAQQTYKDAEATLVLTDEVHKLIEINNKLTEEIHNTIVKKSTSS